MALPWRASAHRTGAQERDDELNEAITREYHFGGDDFFTKKKAAGPEDEATEQKTKKEARMFAFLVNLLR